MGYRLPIGFEKELTMRNSLRLRLLATVALLVIPLAIVLAVVQSRLEHQLMVTEAADALYERAESQRHRCEELAGDWPRAPRRRGRRRQRLNRPRGITVYSDEFIAAAGRKAIPREIAKQLKNGDTGTHREGRDLYIGVRMPYDGPCAIVVQRRRAPKKGVTNILLALMVSLAAAGIAFVAAGPLVRRIRKLHQAVETGAVIEAGREDELGILASSFARQRQELSEKVEALEKRDQTLTDYVANTTHDVMIPLSVLQGHLTTIEAASKRSEAVDPTEVAQAMEEAQYLGSLVANLNVATKLEAGRPVVLSEDVDLSALVSRVDARHQPIAKRKQVEVAFSAPERCIVKGDETLIEQALSNVVHNAIRYNQSGGHVAVVLSSSLESVTIEVRDDGPGVSQSELARLGQRSYRTTMARERHASGTGLGLSIAKDVLEKHSGKFEISLVPEGGLKVSLTFPKDVELS